ncbi:MAG: hypothetical protein AAFZ52_04220 [Bacteroidota bacterium]
MKSSIHFLFACLLLSLTSCYPDEQLPIPFPDAISPDPASEYLVFGRHLLAGADHDLFLLTREGLYRDVPELSPEAERRFQREPLPAELHQMALPLFDYPIKLREQRIWGQDDFGGTDDGISRLFLRAGPANGDFLLFFYPTDATTPEWVAPLLEHIERSYCNANHYRSQVNPCGR